MNYVAPVFHINFHGIQTEISMLDVESPSFSYCRLHRRFLAPNSNVPFMSDALLIGIQNGPGLY